MQAIGDLTGTTLKVDMNMTQHARGKFAKICVELDLDKPLVPYYNMDKEILRVCLDGVFGEGKVFQERIQNTSI